MNIKMSRSRSASSNLFE